MKKGILLAVCLMLAGMLSVGGTYASGESQSPFEGIFAWLSDTFGDFGNPKESDGTVGVQNVYQVRDENGNLTDGQADYLVPAPMNANADQHKTSVKVDGHSYELWTETDVPWAADKFISVKNVEEKDVFFRTAIAIQYDSIVWEALHVNLNTHDFSWKNSENIQSGNLITIDGKDYVMLVATYKNTLAAGETSPAMMMQVALDDITITNEQLANALDMRVTTMAIEAEGFTKKDEQGNTVQMSAEEALKLAIPLDANFKPFG